MSTLDMPQVVSPRLPAVRWGGTATLLAALALAPLFLDSYYLHALIIAMIFLLPAHGLNLILGYTGMLSLAQGQSGPSTSATTSRTTPIRCIRKAIWIPSLSRPTHGATPPTPLRLSSEP